MTKSEQFAEAALRVCTAFDSLELGTIEFDQATRELTAVITEIQPERDSTMKAGLDRLSDFTRAISNMKKPIEALRSEALALRKL